MIMGIPYLIFASIIFFSNIFSAQTITQTKFGKVYQFETQNSAFPNEKRLEGHTYQEQHFSFEEHYQDSSVNIFIPNNFQFTDSINLVFYFHGWKNSIDSTLRKFNLIKQFSQSNYNGILILPECAKNSPDSFGGNLENKNVFKLLVGEIQDSIQNIFHKKIGINKITLAGHSGGYRVMSYILLHGGLTEKIKNVFLFDGLYADIEKYSYWLDNFNGRFIDIYTPNGGTKGESENLMNCLDAWEIQYKFIVNDDFSSDNLKNERIIFIKSELGHNEVIHIKNQFKKFLESSF